MYKLSNCPTLGAADDSDYAATARHSASASKSRARCRCAPPTSTVRPANKAGVVQPAPEVVSVVTDIGLDRVAVNRESQ